MNFFSDTREIVSRFGDSIEDFHDVFRCNGVDFGSPDDFFAFARTMKYHSDLRGDVARVAKTVIEIENDISLRSLLTVIAVASGGPDIGACDREMDTPVNFVIESLISGGICTRFHADHVDSPCSGSMSNDLGDSNTLAESLSRLERGSLELKTYLDSIDERINRIEPRLKNIRPPALSSPTEEAERGFSPAIPFELEVQADNNLRGTKQQRTAGDSNTGITRHFRRPGSHWIFAGVAALLVAVSLFWFKRDAGYVLVQPPNSSPISEADVAGDSPISPEPSSEKGNSVASIKSKKSARSHFISAPSSFRRTADSVAPPVKATEISENTGSDDRTDNLSPEPGSNPLVKVASGVMEANLVSGPRPSYPMLASLTHMQGNVVMQAVISKDGVVKHLQVIKGHRLLRGAAKNAVKTWRYRPYKVDGMPVEVATVVTVDFDSHR